MKISWNNHTLVSFELIAQLFLSIHCSILLVSNFTTTVLYVIQSKYICVTLKNVLYSIQNNPFFNVIHIYRA